jgi:aryl-alcohol dehydrogenase-like predicted oxidoreductase
VIDRRTLGTTGIELAPLIVSGAFGLTPGSLAFAVERGVDTFFWEPRYANLGRFLRQRSRANLQVIAGSFHADRAGLEADLELALRRLERETIDVFLLFWARSPARLGGESLDVLREFQQRGRIRSFGFSTHDRTIACEAIATGDWPVVMTRHSAAHLGAEHELFPRAHAAGVGMLSFSALCYGRMLRGSSVFERGPEAVDCYRYSLAQAGVSACISAPRRHRELVENLGLLDRPPLELDQCEALRAHGREVHADNKRFDRLVRRGGSAPLREAILELFERAGEPDEAGPELAH